MISKKYSNSFEKVLSYLITLFVVILLSSCTTSKKATYTYINSSIPAKDQNERWLIDRGECLERSNKIPLHIKTPCFRSGFSKGYCEGEQNKLLTESKEARQQVFEGCIAKKGYKKVPNE